MSSPISLQPQLTTKSGRALEIGFGVGTAIKDRKRKDSSQSSIDGIVASITAAIDAGFFHLDTAEAYQNTDNLSDAIQQSGAKREDLFITTKYLPGHTTYFKKTSFTPMAHIDESLQLLKTEYLDLVLIHHPYFSVENSFGHDLTSLWKELIQAKKEGKVRYIGVSNFAPDHLETIFKASESKDDYPVLNQVEFHPYLQNQSHGLLEFSKKHNILVEAYGPLSPLFRIKKDGVVINDHPLKTLLPQLSSKYGKTEAQILLRYTLQKGVLPVTTSSRPARLSEALEVYNFTLEQSDVDLIDKRGNEFPFRAFNFWPQEPVSKE